MNQPRKINEFPLWHPKIDMEVAKMWTPGSRFLKLEIKEEQAKEYSIGDYVPFEDKVLGVEEIEESDFHGFKVITFYEPREIDIMLQDGPPLTATQSEWMETMNTKMAALENRLDSLIKIIRKDL